MSLSRMGLLVYKIKRLKILLLCFYCFIYIYVFNWWGTEMKIHYKRIEKHKQQDRSTLPVSLETLRLKIFYREALASQLRVDDWVCIGHCADTIVIGKVTLGYCIIILVHISPVVWKVTTQNK